MNLVIARNKNSIFVSDCNMAVIARNMKMTTPREANTMEHKTNRLYIMLLLLFIKNNNNIYNAQCSAIPSLFRSSGIVCFLGEIGFPDKGRC